jgi:ankyrin repeat protein
MSKLHDQCCDGRPEQVLGLISTLDYDDINKTDHDGNIPLHSACLKNHIEMAVVSKKAHASRSIRNNSNQRAQDLVDKKNEKRHELFSPHGVNTNSDRLSEYSSEADDRTVSSKAMNFYFACQNGQVEYVRDLLKNITLHKIDRLQSNGSTALHAACFFNHDKIVEMLLRAGASRGIKNKHGFIPYEEASNEPIQSIFKRMPGDNRFLGDSEKFEWRIVTPYAKETAAGERHALAFYKDKSLVQLVSRIKELYLSKDSKNIDKLDQVMYFFQQAIDKGNPEYIIKAYTAETGFYSRLNRDLAGRATSGRYERNCIVGIMAYHPAFERHTYFGMSYRGMKMTVEDLALYTAGSLIMTKSFLSTTKDKKTIESFMQGTTVRASESGYTLKFLAFCTYISKNRRTALAIENMSEYQNEKEVLIMPYVVFSVKTVKQRSDV